MKNKPDPVFAAYAASAPRLDLSFYFAYATQKDRYKGSTPATQAIICEMACLLDSLAGTKPGPLSARKRHVWQLIDRYKTSIVGWSHGERADWEDPYFTIANALTRAFFDVPELTDVEREMLGEAVSNAA